jgi:5-formyltetrahydrofolate cyclo-ligase
MVCLEQWRCVLLPKVWQDMQMDVYRIRSMQECTVGAYGIGEPDPTKATLWESGISFGVIPCRVVDMFGWRVGRWVGYYDRFFTWFPQMYRVWVAYSQQCIEQVPMDIHDVPMHQVIVE